MVVSSFFVSTDDPCLFNNSCFFLMQNEKTAGQKYYLVPPTVLVVPHVKMSEVCKFHFKYTSIVNCVCKQKKSRKSCDFRLQFAKLIAAKYFFVLLYFCVRKCHYFDSIIFNTHRSRLYASPIFFTPSFDSIISCNRFNMLLFY